MSLTKGFIKNNTTKITKDFMYNPTEIKYSRSATYVDISAPGSPYPQVAFVKGNSTTIPVTLFLADKAGANNSILPFIAFMEEFLPKENSSALFEKPTIATVSMGHLIRNCVVENLDINILDYTNRGIPTRAELTLSLKVVA